MATVAGVPGVPAAPAAAAVPAGILVLRRTKGAVQEAQVGTVRKSVEQTQPFGQGTQAPLRSL